MSPILPTYSQARPLPSISSSILNHHLSISLFFTIPIANELISYCSEKIEVTVFGKMKGGDLKFEKNSCDPDLLDRSFDNGC